MNITWYGQSCFRLEGKSTSILIDPFNKDIGLKPPRLNTDIVLVNHNHPEHNIVEASPDVFVIQGPGEYEKAGVHVEGIKSFHDAIFVIRYEDITLCHLGNLGQDKLTDEQIEAIGDVDILFIPVGGGDTIDGKQAAELIKEIEPKIIIPMRYKIPGLNIEIEGPQKFIKELGLKPEEVDVLKINAKTLPTDEIKLVMFSARGGSAEGGK